jgi:hypothetical protein
LEGGKEHVEVLKDCYKLIGIRHYLKKSKMDVHDLLSQLLEEIVSKWLKMNNKKWGSLHEIS